jgi:hypothetical protein
MTVAEKMAFWNRDHTDSEVIPVEWPGDDEGVLTMDDKMDENDEPPIPSYHEARKFLFRTEAYQHLQSRIQTVSLLTSRKGQIVQDIRSAVLGKLATQHSSANPWNGPKKDVNGLQPLELEISWDPMGFLATQYGYNDETAFKDIIAITSSAIDAQATTCGLYVAQVWPRTGQEILNALDALIRHMSRSHKCKNPNLLCYFYLLL